MKKLLTSFWNKSDSTESNLLVQFLRTMDLDSATFSSHWKFIYLHKFESSLKLIVLLCKSGFMYSGCKSHYQDKLCVKYYKNKLEVFLIQFCSFSCCKRYHRKFKSQLDHFKSLSWTKVKSNTTHSSLNRLEIRPYRSEHEILIAIHSD